MNELQKLIKYLEEHNYNIEVNHVCPYTIDGKDDPEIPTQVIVYGLHHRKLWDAVLNDLSLGNKLGLIEVMGDISDVRYDDVEGFLTADDIITRLEKRDVKNK